MAEVILNRFNAIYLDVLLFGTRSRVARKVGAGDRSRTYTGVSPEDFESSASAIPPLRHASILGQLSLVGNRCPQLSLPRMGDVVLGL